MNTNLVKSHLISYADAILEATDQAMELDDRVFIMGQLVDYAPGVFGTTSKLVEKYGIDRVRDFPVSESAMTAAAIGASVTGMRPILVHHRLDFMIYAMDAIVNWMALWRFKSNGECSLPLVIRVVVGKGWGQGPQHSKSLHSWFAHIPGIKVIMPANAYDVKGMLLEAILGQNPVIVIEHRSLFGIKENVPIMPYRVKLGHAAVLRNGVSVTFIAMGLMVNFAEQVADQLVMHRVFAEIIDLRTISPIDSQKVIASVSKTRRVCVFDPGWSSFGVSAEIIALVAENCYATLEAAPIRVAYPNSHTPMSQALELEYYPKVADVVAEILNKFNL